MTSDFGFVSSFILVLVTLCFPFQFQDKKPPSFVLDLCLLSVLSRTIQLWMFFGNLSSCFLFDLCVVKKCLTFLLFSAVLCYLWINYLFRSCPVTALYSIPLCVFTSVVPCELSMIFLLIPQFDLGYLQFVLWGNYTLQYLMCLSSCHSLIDVAFFLVSCF